MALRAFVRRYEYPLVVLAVALAATVPYGVVNALTHGRAAQNLDTFVDRAIPFTPEWEYVYAWFVLFAFLPLCVITDLRYFRRVALAHLATYAAGNLTFLLFPTRVVRVPVTGPSFLEWGIRLNHYIDAPNNCFPSLHVAGAVLASLCVLKVDRVLGAVAGVWALLIAVSTLMLKAHFFADVLGALVLAGGTWALFVRPAEHRGPPRSRWVAALLPAAFLAVVGGLWVAWRVGVQIPPSPWDAQPPL